MRLLLIVAVGLSVLLASTLGAHGEPHTSPKPAPPRKPPTHHHLHAARLPLHVTMIGDSVADEIAYVDSAQHLLERGVHLELELAACRRLVEPSCTVAGVQPTTT